MTADTADMPAMRAVTFTDDGEEIVGELTGYAVDVACTFPGCRWNHTAHAADTDPGTLAGVAARMTALHQTTRNTDES